MVNKTKQLPIRFLLIALLFFAAFKSYAQTTYLHHFGTKEGLPSNNCFYTLQDSKGYIWIGTDAGVSRFDGKVFENFSVDDGLPDNQILQLEEDNIGRIWFLALNGQLSYFFNGKIYNETNDKLLKQLKFNAVIVSFFQDSEGRIWLGTNKNLLIMWNGKSIVKYTSSNNSSYFINTFVHEDKSGKIWAFSYNTVKIFDGTNFNIVPGTNLPASYKTAVNLPDRTMAYIDKTGLVIKDNNKDYFQYPIDPLLLNNNPGYFHLDRSNEVWLSNGSGIHHINHTGKVKDYLDNISSSQVIEDMKGNMWFTTNNGIYMLPRKDERMYIFNKANGLSNDIVKSIVKDNQNRLWLGMDNACINTVSLNDFSISKLPLPNKKQYPAIKHLYFDSAYQTIYFASEYGLGRVKNIHSNTKEVDYLREINDIMIVIKNFSVAKDKSIALALSSGILIIPDRFKKFEFDKFSFKEGANFFDSRAYSVFYDKDQNLWYSNIDGLSKLTGNKPDNFYQKSPLLTRRINDIKELSDGTIVLATDGYGLIFIKGQKIIKLVTQHDGLADNICRKLFVKTNSVWVVTNTGISKVSINTPDALVETFEYTSALLNDNVNYQYIDSAYAYFATNNGLVYFPINKIKTTSEKPRVLLSSIVNNKVKLELNRNNHILAPSNNNITFYYSAIDFQNKNITYRYRLKADANWTETKTRRLEFSSLEPGEYTFEISARFNNGDWGKITQLNFILEKHFWQTFWFLGIILLIAGFALYKAAVVVTQRQKNKEQEQLLLKNKILMLEQRALQAMMNPHFVFNVMNSIQHYINTKDTTSANKVLTGFARLIRKNLDICTKSYITLEEELEYLELYLSLEKKRFGEKFNYVIQVNKAIDREETLIPSMLLQPYVENAIWHGIMPQETGGKVEIHINMNGEDHLLIRIVDDGIGIDNSLKEKKGQHMSKGMELTKERINLLNQVEANPIQIEIKQTGNSGTLVAMAIPLK